MLVILWPDSERECLCSQFNNVYHEAADRRSTLSMLSLFAECWPDVLQRPVATNACGTQLGQVSSHAMLPCASELWAHF